MTTLQTRPTTRDAARTGGSGRGPAASAPTSRPLSVSAGVAGAGVALGGLVVFWAVSLTGWFFADGGAHGSTRDALRVGADAWVVGHGSHLTLGGVDYTLVPLGLTALLGWAAYRAGRWAGRVSPIADERELVLGSGLFTSGYVVVAVVTAVLAGTSDVRGSLVLTVLGALVLGGVVGSAGLLTGAGRWSAVGERLPAWVEPVVRSVAAVVLGLVACGALLATVSFALHIGDAATLVSRLGLHPGDAVMLALASAAVAPNAALLGTAYLLGPGFAVGVGTTVSPGVVALGPVPAFPLLSALPDDGATSWVATATMVVPPLVAAVAVALVQRRHPVRAWDLAALRGAGSGVLAGFAVGVVCALGGGALGDGRMADVGAPAAQVMVSGALSLGIGGLLGALVTTSLQRRRPSGPEAEDTVAVETGPPVVKVPARPDEPTVRLRRDRLAETPAETPAESSGESSGETQAEPDVVVGEVTEAVDEGFGERELRARFRQQTAHAPADPDPDPDREDTVRLDRD